MASETPAGVTKSTHNANAKADTADVLHRFGQCASVVRDVLYDDRALDDEEFIFIDKHFQILNMAFSVGSGNIDQQMKRIH